MLIYAITFLLFSGALCLVSERECFAKIRTECDAYRVPNTFPDTIEEADAMCREVSNYAKCSLPLLRECGQQKDVDFVGNLVKFTETRCDPENPTYEAITSNLKCVVDAYRSAHAGACVDISEEKEAAIDKYKEDLREQGKSQQEIFKCLEQVWETACSAALVEEKCGRLAGNAVLDISVNLDYILRNTCSEEVIADLPIITEGFLLAENEENILESLIRRRK